VRHFGFRISDFGLAAALLAAVLATSSAAAQTVDVAASLDITDGWARPGAYVPVRLKATNRTDETVIEVRIRSAGPVAVVCPWRLGPGESGMQVVPLYYGGGDLAPTLEFADSRGKVAGRVSAGSLQVRAVAADAAVIACPSESPELDDSARLALKQQFKVAALHVLRLPADSLTLLMRLGMSDAVIDPGRPAPETLHLRLASFPDGVAEPVQPEAYRLFAAKVWPPEDRRRLWMYLGIFSLAVLAAAVLVSRRRPLVAALALVGVALAAMAVIYFFGDVRRAVVREARVFYVGAPETRAALEHFVYLESRGGALARLPLPQPGVTPLPVPVLAAAEDLFRTQATLVMGDQERMETRQAQVLLHILEESEPTFAAAKKPDAEALRSLAGRADVIAALLVEGDRAADAAGRAQTIDAWAVAWRSSADPDIAYAGRSLAWWDKARRLGDGPFLLAWFRDPPPADAGEATPVQRLPALVVWCAAP